MPKKLHQKLHRNYTIVRTLSLKRRAAVLLCAAAPLPFKGRGRGGVVYRINVYDEDGVKRFEVRVPTPAPPLRGEGSGCAYICGSSRKWHFTIVGWHFTNMRWHFTIMGRHFTIVGWHFTNMGWHFTKMRNHFMNSEIYDNYENI